MANSQALELVTNGSFNAPLLTSSVVMTNNMPGWTNVVLSPLGYNFTGIYLSAEDAVTNGFNDGTTLKLWQATPSPDGGSFIADDGDPNYHTSIQQNISGLVKGQSYNLSFYYAGAEITQRTGPTTEWWDVSLGGSTQSTPVLNNASQSFTGWQKATMTFVATSSQELLSFTAGGTPTGQPPMVLLDGVSLVAAVPEPASYACLALGLAMLGAARYRMRQNRPAGTA